MSKVWFITGTSRGFGREFARAALGRGDRVVATARDTASLDDLVGEFGDAVLPLALDVTDRAAACAAPGGGGGGGGRPGRRGGQARPGAGGAGRG
ncbi:SDR family NAD(P)-dependent oxidoreductase, partial [Cellulomonas sp. GbtcB1]|uniref:SDR family NAD(P)-dependent oxidoreductase n=1 Tax=Cellulomonas sp. GbtcB1 TaxID=2824746 RepID=UPI001C3021DB